MSKYSYCPHCEYEYELTVDNCIMHIYYEDGFCNHIETTCDHCNRSTWTYITGDSVIAYKGALDLNTYTYARCGQKALKEQARTIWAEAVDPSVDQPVHPKPAPGTAKTLTEAMEAEITQLGKALDGSSADEIFGFLQPNEPGDLPPA